MKSKSAHLIWNEAHEKLNFAQESMKSNPSTSEKIKICQLSKQAMSEFLQSYLIDHRVPEKPLSNIAIQAEQCASLDKRFRRLNLSEVNCRYEQVTQEHCTNMNKLRKCLKVAHNVGMLTKEGANAYDRRVMIRSN